jgi:iron complex outermembrane receptor protein
MKECDPVLRSICLLAAFVVSKAWAQESRTIELEEITVEAVRPSGSTARSVEEAREQLDLVPGGTALIEAEEFRDGATANLQNVLSFVPGVYSQDRFGGDENRLSIRGSGISQDFAIKGVRLLRNGLPITEADGDFHSQLVEALTARYVEVYRGANALQYGASTLGGAVNFVTYAGHTAKPLSARLEAGSYGYLRPQLSGGKVLGESWDYYASLSGSYVDGFRAQAETDSTRFYGNIGYRPDGRSETRLHASIEDNNQQIPGALTRSELKDDPRQASDFFAAFNSQNNFDRYRADLQHVVMLENGRLDAGAFYEMQDIFHPLPFFVRDEDQLNSGLSLRHEIRHGEFFDNRFVWGGFLAFGDVKADDFEPLGDAVRGSKRLSENSDVLTSELFAEDQLQLTHRLMLSLGVQLAYSERATDFKFADPTLADTRIEDEYFALSPKVGLVWNLTRHAQVFGNVSRSFEPPILLDFNDTTFGTLDAQTATTIEIGTRGSSDRFAWDLALYRAWINDEILRAEVPPLPSGVFATANADDTVHSGIELGIDAKVLDWLAEGAMWLRAVYTYNRFRFDGDASFGDNEIPGIPRHFGRLEIMYKDPSGFYAGPNVEMASRYFVDFANSLETDAYAIYGFRAGYTKQQRLSVFIEARNLEDEAYASNTGIIADAQGIDVAAFNPGIGRSAFAGVEIAW